MYGTAWQARPGEVRLGETGLGRVRPVRHVAARRGKAGVAGQGAVRHGRAWFSVAR